MPTYLCDDGNAEIEITADTAREAAQDYVDGGDWGDADGTTTYIDVYVQAIPDETELPVTSYEWEAEPGVERGMVSRVAPEERESAMAACEELGLDVSESEHKGHLLVSVAPGERERITITIEPDEPECSADAHDWKTPHSVLGGIKENPGVWGNGGGVIAREVCAHCGRYRETNTWAQRRDTGEQGLTEVKYEDADDSSLEWLRGREYTEVESLLAEIIEVSQRSGSSIAYAAIQDDGEGSGDEMLARIREALGAGYTADWTGEGNGVGADRTSDIYIDRSSTLPNE